VRKETKNIWVFNMVKLMDGLSNVFYVIKSNRLTPSWKYPKRPSTGEWVGKLWYVHTVD
jgi:hypothetical protein